MREKRGRTALMRCLAALSFLLIFALALTFVSDVLRGRDTPVFYTEKKNSLDVLFLGSSHMLNGVSPMELWAEYGMASCNLSENGQLLPVTYYVLMDALDRQNPKLVVLDVYKVVQDTLFDTKSYLHTSIDCMPMGPAKLQAVYDLLPPGERMEFLFDIVLYHDRWKELGGIERDERDPDFKGYSPLYGTESHEGFQILPESETAPPPEVAVEYLRKIVELCRDRGVELLLVATPFTTPVSDGMDRQRRLNAVSELAEEWNVPFINMMYRLDEVEFDLSADLADTYHANVSGMRKITGFLGEFITERYDIPDRRGDEKYAKWDETYERYARKLEEAGKI